MVTVKHPLPSIKEQLNIWMTVIKPVSLKLESIYNYTAPIKPKYTHIHVHPRTQRQVQILAMKGYEGQEGRINQQQKKVNVGTLSWWGRRPRERRQGDLETGTHCLFCCCPLGHTQLHSRDPDEIHLRGGAKEPVKTITRLFSTTSERSQLIPVNWKRACVVPIFNKGNKEDLQNHRPEFQLTSGSWTPFPNTGRKR